MPPDTGSNGDGVTVRTATPALKPAASTVDITHKFANASRSGSNFMEGFYLIFIC